MKYKVGDRVKIKSLDWYNENKDEDGEIVCGEFAFLKDMKKFCSETLTISADVDDGYLMFEDDHGYVWTDEMFEKLVERNGKTYPYKIGDRVILKGNNRCATVTDLKYNSSGNLSYYVKIDNDKDISIDYPTDLLSPYDNKVEGLAEEETLIERVDDNGLPFNEWLSHKGSFHVSDGYELKDENGNVINAQKIVLEKKKKEYPKTYEECCYVTGFENTEMVFEDDYRDINPPKEQWKRLELINQLNKLLICRDAYWKIAGEEMGLGKPWAPDWEDYEQKKFVFVVEGNTLIKKEYSIQSCILSFPTTEMRNAFKENFKELIEQCKELL